MERRPRHVGRSAGAGRLAEIAVPTLVITGAQDVPEISAVGELLVMGIASARAAVIENADHVVPWRAPDELAGLILEFLAQTSTPRRCRRSASQLRELVEFARGQGR